MKRLGILVMMCVAIYLIWSLEASMLPVAQAQEADADGQGKQRNAIVLRTWNKADLRKQLLRWRLELEEPKGFSVRCDEHLVVAALLGSPPSHVGPGFEPPKRIVRYMLTRGLDYHEWKSRKAAVRGFTHVFEEKPGQLTPILRDGLNDPHPDVRSVSIECIGETLHLLIHGPPGREWNEAIKPKLDGYIDILVDLLVTKGLVDEEDKLVEEAFIYLDDDIVPTMTRLRSLDRALANKRFQQSKWFEYAHQQRKEWYFKIHGIKPPEPKPPEPKPLPPEDDPFGGNVPVKRPQKNPE